MDNFRFGYRELCARHKNIIKKIFNREGGLRDGDRWGMVCPCHECDYPYEYFKWYEDLFLKPESKQYMPGPMKSVVHLFFRFRDTGSLVFFPSMYQIAEAYITHKIPCPLHPSFTKEEALLQLCKNFPEAAALVEDLETLIGTTLHK